MTQDLIDGWSQHWFWQWHGAIWQQDITWSSVDTDLWYHKASLCHSELTHLVNSLRLWQTDHHFAEVFKCIFLNENVWISLEISLKFVPKVWNNNIPGLVQIMAWRRTGDKPLSEPMVVILLAHKCVTLPQWVNVQKYLLVFRGHPTQPCLILWCQPSCIWHRPGVPGPVWDIPHRTWTHTHTSIQDLCLLVSRLWFHYNMIIFFWITHNRHPIAHSLGWAMGCLLWVQNMMNVLPLPLPSCSQHSLYCIWL